LLVLVCYDVSTVTAAGKRRLRRVADVCENHGVRVQFSVFECPIDAATWLRMRRDLLKIFDGEQDSLRFYFLEGNPGDRTEHHGVRRPMNLKGTLMF
jgi:CRISPR-associated protein Cas2